MRYLILSLSCVALLAGCQSHKVVEESPATLTATLPEVDTSKAPGMLEQYHVGAFTVGGWVNQKLGQFFTPIQPQNAQAAVVYLYRPDTRWNRQEIAAANLFINGHRIPSLLHNHYYWLELPAGTYRLSVSRPLAGLHFQKPKYLDFTVEPAQTYFIKYDEENLSTRREVSGPLMIVPEKTGLNEIAFTQWKSESFNFVANDQNTGKVRKKAQKLKPAKYDPSSDVQLTQPFKIWNPTTW